VIPPGREPRPTDAGLANERTALAWIRTALSLAVSGALTIRLGVENDLTLAGVVVGGALLVFAAGMWSHGAHAYRRRQESWEAVAWEMPERPDIADRRILAATATVTVIAALTSLAFAVLTIA
jgi:uncharacterized membrane protein YidH (DUF202 family)